MADSLERLRETVESDPLQRVRGLIEGKWYLDIRHEYAYQAKGVFYNSTSETFEIHTGNFFYDLMGENGREEQSKKIDITGFLKDHRFAPREVVQNIVNDLRVREQGAAVLLGLAVSGGWGD